MTATGKRTIRLLFVLALLSLPVNLALTRFVGEPFPALTQPMFGGNPAKSGSTREFQTTVTVIFADRTRKTVPLSTLLPSTGQDQTRRWKILLGTQSAADNPTTVHWVSNVLSRIFPKQNAAEMIVVWREIHHPIDPHKASVTTKVSTITVEVKND